MRFMQRERGRPGVFALFAMGALVLAGCLGGGGDSAPAVPVASGLQPTVDGFAFPNFASESYDVEFADDDVVDMFGTGPAVCVDGVADPCKLTAEAAAFARMVNQARATGHCEGLVVVAQSRFNEKQSPQTVALPDEGDTIRAIMRAFATQFVPEVQTEIQSWLARPLADKIAALAESFAQGKIGYTLGVYTPEGGHAVLPYAIEYPSKDVARVMVYDSNWPAKNRWVDVDLKANTWSFSFEGEDPANDPAVWTGGADRMDLTNIETRQGSCPFCGDGTTVVKNTLLVRTENLDWSVEVDGTTVSPDDPLAGAEQGIVVKPVKGSSDASRRGGRNAYDYVIEVPVQTGAGATTSTTVASGETRSKLTFSGTTSLFALTPGGIAQVQTSGNPDIPVEVGSRSIVSKDPGVSLTLASGNLVASASGPQASLSVAGETLAVTVQTANGQVVEQAVTPESPAAKIVADPTTGGVTSLVQSASGTVLKTAVAADGTETKTVEAAGSLNLSSTTFEAPKGLESKPIESLPPPSARNLANPEYKADVPYVAPTTTVQSGQIASQAVTPVRPVIGRFEIAQRTFGDAPFAITAPTSTSDGDFSFASSDSSVIEVSATGRATVVGVGTATVTAVQEATTRHLPATVTTQVRVVRARPVVGTVGAVVRRFGDAPFTITAPTSTSPAEFTWESTDQRVVRVAPTTGRVTITGVGSATLVATQLATANFEATERRITVTVARRSNSLPTVATLTRTFGDAPFTIAAPGSVSTGVFTWTSSNDQVVAVDAATGLARVTGVGTATVRITQAVTATDEAGSTSTTVTVSRATTSMGPLTLPVLDTNSQATRVANPTSTSTAAITWTSSDTSVATVGASTGLVTPVAPGTTTITARQAESATHTAGTVAATLTVSRGTPMLGSLSVTSRTFGDAPFTIPPPSSPSTGAFTWTSSNTAVATVGASTGTVTIVGAGQTVITVSQAETVLYGPSSTTVPLSVAKSLQSPLVVTTTGGETGESVPLVVTGGSGTGAVTWTRTSAGTAGCTVAGSNVTASSAGTCQVVASKAADTNYEAASSGAVTLTFVAPVSQTECSTSYSLDGLYAVERITTVGSCGWTAPIGVTEVSYLVVGGGGGGASGGGGGGGVRTNHGGTAFPVIAGRQYSVTVGAGGSAGNGQARGASGGNSMFADVTALGGGGGGGNNGNAPLNGGSGGGGGYDQPGLTRTTGTAGQGFGGGRSGHGGYGAGGGGGGAGGAGADAPIQHLGGAGGIGLQSSITGTATYFGGGGGGGVNHNCNCSVSNGGGAGGLGGGGIGSTLGNGGGAWFDGTSGTDGLGGGGGGTDPESTVAGRGGSGVVIVRYLAPTVWGVVDENQDLTLTAPAGHKFVAVVFASYGTPTGSNGSYATSWCHAAVSVQTATDAFLTRSTATLAASNGVFGDPCGGTYKRLAVTLAVKPG